MLALLVATGCSAVSEEDIELANTALDDGKRVWVGLYDVTLPAGTGLETFLTDKITGEWGFLVSNPKSIISEVVASTQAQFSDQWNYVNGVPGSASVVQRLFSLSASETEKYLMSSHAISVYGGARGLLDMSFMGWESYYVTSAELRGETRDFVLSHRKGYGRAVRGSFVLSKNRPYWVGRTLRSPDQIAEAATPPSDGNASGSSTPPPSDVDYGLCQNSYEYYPEVNSDCRQQGGRCVNATTCDGATLGGLCPGSSSIRCYGVFGGTSYEPETTNGSSSGSCQTAVDWFPQTSSECSLAGGRCVDTRSCGGVTSSGMCPGASYIKCSLP